MLGVGSALAEPVAASKFPAVGQNPAVRKVAPALASYRQDVVEGSLWQRRELSPRDRSLVTVAILVARNQGAEMAYQMHRAIDNGVTPHELSELITHLAFYSGWGDAMAALTVANEVFGARGIGADQLPSASPTLLPIEPVGEALRATRVEAMAGTISPGLVKYTGELLFQNLWLRPELAPRDRSLVTISALIATGQVAQLPSHLNLGMDKGLTRVQIGEVITQSAFYAGWPRAFSAVTVAAAVYAERDKALPAK